MRRFSKARGREALAGYLFIMPNFVGFLIFTSWPVLYSLFLSFHQWDILRPKQYVGLTNFVRLVGFKKELVEVPVAGTRGMMESVVKIVPRDPVFWKYLFNTLFLMASIPLNILAALGLAIVLNQRLRGVVFFRTLFFLPSVTVGVALYMLWRWIYNPDFGLLNCMTSQLCDLLGLPYFKIEWLSSTLWAKPALMLMTTWTVVGGRTMIIYLAALQTIPRELYEAAEIDGANGWQQFWHITWPMLAPATFFVFVMSVIGGFQGGFEAQYIMTQGGPAGSTTGIAYYIYMNAFQWFHMGYAAAVSWVLFLVIFFLTLATWRFGSQATQYEV